MIEFGLNFTPAYSRCLSDEPPPYGALLLPPTVGPPALSGSLYTQVSVSQLLGIGQRML